MTDDALRLAGAICCDALAFVLWNVGSRTPRDLLEDLRATLRSPARLIGALVLTLLGAIFFATGIVLVVPTVVDPRVDLFPVALFTMLVGLVVDFLIGADLRRLVVSTRAPR